MPTAALRSNTPSTKAEQPLSVRLGDTIAAVSSSSISPAAREKLRICLLDFLACAFEASVLPWARQAQAIGTAGAGPCTIIGTALKVPAADAAFANGVAGHGLVREDMHTGSVSHLGVLVLPPLLAIAQERKLDGVAFATAAIIGYEVGGRIGRALITPEFARIFRPSGFVGPMAAAAAVSHALGLDGAQTSSAISLAANFVSGLNQWPHTGADDMFFEVGNATRNGLVAARLASIGAYGAEKALDGEAGLLPAYRPDHTAPDVELFAGEPEIMSVFFKAVPVCNFAQTPCLATLALMRESSVDPANIVSVKVKVTRAAQAYPGCDYAGPFARVLQAKMSIHYAVASALLRGAVNEASYKQLDDPKLVALASKITVEVAPDLTAAYPRKQGAEVSVTLQDGRVVSHRLEDVVAADIDLIRTRFRAAAGEVVGDKTASAIESAVDDLDAATDVGAIMRLTQTRG